MAEQMWELPSVNEEDLHYRVATGLLTEFALGHSPADVLRELVQNEYDAGGKSLEVVFGRDELVVRGRGAVIDAAGWERLSVMLGTGAVAGHAVAIRPKVNGIGSKNFGMRSLFLFGDRIHVFSGGQQTVLDWRLGALPEPRSHPPSVGEPGVVLRVPYRRADSGQLRAFDEHHEKDALMDIATALAPTLVKLVVPGSGKGVRTVVVRSERWGQELTWRQSARELRRQTRPLSRSVRVAQTGGLIADVPRSFTEVEYWRRRRPPKALRARDVPAYFKEPGGRIRLAVSFQTKRRNLVRDAVGRFYYPLGASRSRTGFAFSVSAPFDMTEDRSQLVDVANSDWNAWLIDEVAELAVMMLREDLFETFGAGAYMALDPGHASVSTVPALAEAVEAKLRRKPCWPSMARAAGGRPMFRPVATLVVASTPALREVTETGTARRDLLHPTLGRRPSTVELAARLGASQFTVNSLIRLRSAGRDRSELETRLEEGEADLYFTGFPEALADVDEQVRIAQALDGARGRLSPANKADLRNAATTLTAAGTLESPDRPLWDVDEGLVGVVPKDKMLHPALKPFQVVSRLCSSFKASQWVIDISKRAIEGQADNDECEALRRYILRTPHLSHRAWAMARRAPILLDHRNEPVAATELVLRTTPGAKVIEPALRYLPEAAESKPLTDQLRIRSIVRGEDLVTLAQLVEAGSVPVRQMQEALNRFSKLLTPPVIERLQGIAMLETGDGTLVTPDRAYERNERTLAALGDEASWAVPLPGTLLRRLGCRTEPIVEDIIARLSALETAGVPLDRVDRVYRTLVKAMRSEGRNPAEFRSDRILWTGRAWAAAGMPCRHPSPQSLRRRGARAH